MSPNKIIIRTTDFSVFTVVSEIYYKWQETNKWTMMKKNQNKQTNNNDINPLKFKQTTPKTSQVFSWSFSNNKCIYLSTCSTKYTYSQWTHLEPGIIAEQKAHLIYSGSEFLSSCLIRVLSPFFFPSNSLMRSFIILARWVKCFQADECDRSK